MQIESGRKLFAYAGLVLAALFWAGNAVLARGVADEIRPLTLAFWRWSLALAILLPAGLPHLRRAGGAVRANAGRIFWLGSFSVGAYNTLLYIAAHTTTALNIALVSSTMPIAIAVLAHFVLGERTSPRQATGFAAAALGMLAIVSRGDWRVLAGFGFFEGDLLMIGAVAVWGIYSVLLRRWRIEMHPLGFLTATIVVGVALLFPAFAWEVATYGHFDPDPSHLAVFGYLATLPSIVAYLFWNHAVGVVGPSSTGMFIYLVPVFTAAIAYPVLGESLHAYHAAGGLLILAGLYLATRSGGDAGNAPPMD